MIRTVYGRSKSGTALIPIIGTDTMYLNISTRVGDSVITMGDGSSLINRTNPKLKDFTDGVYISPFTYNYSSRFTGNISIKFFKGLKDIYSIKLGNGVKASATNLYERYNITDIETFFAQFPNLYSLMIDEYAYGITGRMSIIKGDLAKLPNSVEKVLISNSEILNAATDFVLNLSSYTNASKLKRFEYAFGTQLLSTIKITGDLGKFPTSGQFLSLPKASAGSSITYTSGKVWASSFDTLYLPIPLTPAEHDNILIDLQNSVTTAVGAKIIRFGGGYRTHNSDSAVAYLEGLGYTISNIASQTNSIDSTTGLIFKMGFQNNFDTSGNSIVPISEANTNGLPSFVSDGLGGYAVNFSGSKSIKTTVNLPINTSDKVSIEFDMKTTSTAVQMIMELSSNVNSNNAFSSFINDASNKIGLFDHNSGNNSGVSTVNINTGSWVQVKMVIDRSLGKDQNKIYINGVLSFLQTANYNDNNGNYGSYPLFIGQRNGVSLDFVGQIKNLEIYNYAR